MNTVALGQTGLLVSEVGFGGIPIVALYPDEAMSVIRHCFGLGITFYDTANMYGDSEMKIGAALEPVRSRVILATKTMKRQADDAAKHIEQSLQNLRTSMIDIYQIHQIAKRETLEEVLAPGGAYEALRRARAEGKVRAIGFSSHNVETAIEACRTSLFETVQVPFNFIESRAADELFRVAETMGMGIIAMKPLGGGVIGPAELCFRFLQQFSAVVPIPGVKTCEEIDEIVGLYQNRETLNKADREEIERIRSELGTKFCRRCEYCLPCNKGVQIPIVLGFRGFASRLPPIATLALVGPAMRSAESCIGCDECIRKCPYELPIPDLLKENLALFREYEARYKD